MTSPIQLPSQKVSLSPIGMQVTGELTAEEWQALAGSIGQAARSISFIEVSAWASSAQSRWVKLTFETKGQNIEYVLNELY